MVRCSQLGRRHYCLARAIYMCSDRACVAAFCGTHVVRALGSALRCAQCNATVEPMRPADIETHVPHVFGRL